MTVSNAPIPEVPLPHNLTLIQIYDDTSATLTLLAGVTGKRIFIWGMALFVNGATDLLLKSNTTAIGGSMGFAAAGQIVLPKPSNGDPTFQRGFPNFITNVGESLIITNSGSNVRLSGSLWISQQ